MNFKQFLLEDSTEDLLKKIVKIFDKEIKNYSDLYDVKGTFFSSSKPDTLGSSRLNTDDGVVIEFWKKEKGWIDQTATIEIDKQNGKFDLHLSDIYIPHDIMNRGYLTKVLTEIKKLPDISGRCKVHVAINSSWKKIIARSGLEWI